MHGLSSQLLLSQQVDIFPGSVPLLGHLPVFLWSLWRANGNLTNTFERLFQQANQKTFGFKLGRQWFILTLDPDMMHHVLVTAFSQYTKTQRERDVLSSSLSGGLITSEGEAWKTHRRILRPFFGTDYLHSLTTFVQEAVADRVSPWQDVIDVGYEMQMITFDIVARFFLGGKIGHYEKDKTLDVYTNHFIYMEKALEARALSFPRVQDLITNSLKFKTKLHQSFSVIKDLISYRLEKSANEEGSILQELLKAFKTEDIVVQEMLNIIAASLGSAHVLSWICALLAQDPYRQKKLKAEIEHFFSDRKGKTGITLERLDQLPYLSAVVNEGLRLYPPAPYLIRTLESHPAAPHIVLSIWSMHRHPALWTQPEVFVPERWLVPEDATASSPHTTGPLRTFAAFLPFGAGPRTCIGRGFALVEIKLILINILQRFTLRLLDPVLPAAQATILTRPKRRIHLEVAPVADVQET
jgi:cytochrome P450